LLATFERTLANDWIRHVAISEKTSVQSGVSAPDIARGLSAFYEANAISADAFARAVAFALAQPEDMDVNEILYRPTRQIP
jgi:NADP-dependent 3-hydroxy acid dehydrogenase YdfG